MIHSKKVWEARDLIAFRKFLILWLLVALIIPSAVYATNGGNGNGNGGVGNGVTDLNNPHLQATVVVTGTVTDVPTVVVHGNGNEGTVKISQTGTDVIPDNDPHVVCQFFVLISGLTNTGTYVVTEQGGLNGQDNGSQVLSGSFSGTVIGPVSLPAGQYKVEVTDTDGHHAKSKVFRVTPCATVTPTVTVVPTVTVTPTETSTSVPSTATSTATTVANTATATATGTSAPTATSTAVPTSTSTAVPTATPTATTLVVATATNTPAATETNTPVPATSTPTATATTVVAPTATNTPVPPTATSLSGGGAPRPTATSTPTRPTATNTPRPTATSTATARPTNTSTPQRPTATNTPRPTSTATPMATATSTPRATSTPQPTATSTPRPTATARPTATPRPVRRHPTTGRAADPISLNGFAPVLPASYAYEPLYATFRISGQTFAARAAHYPVVLYQNAWTVDSDYQNLGRPGLTYAYAHDDLIGDAGTVLYNLRPGQVIWVQRGNHHYRYVVTSNVTVAPTNVSALTRHYSRSTLVLVTCTPYGVDTSRVVVTAVLS